MSYAGKSWISAYGNYANYLYETGSSFGNPPPHPPTEFLLLEDGGFILLENGEKIELE